MHGNCKRRLKLHGLPSLMAWGSSKGFFLLVSKHVKWSLGKDKPPLPGELPSDTDLSQNIFGTLGEIHFVCRVGVKGKCSTIKPYSQLPGHFWCFGFLPLPSQSQEPNSGRKRSWWSSTGNLKRTHQWWRRGLSASQTCMH